MPERSTTSVVIALTTRVVVILLILAMGVGGFVVLWATSGEVAVSDDQAEAPTVPVFKLQRVNVREQWLGQGVAEALDSADLPARVSSTVAWIADDALPGARVKAGDPLIRLDDSDYQRRVSEQKNTLAAADAELEQLKVEAARLKDRLKLAEEEAKLANDETDRVRDLFSKRAANQQDVDRARRQALAAEQLAVQLREAVEKTPGRIAQIEARQNAQQAALHLAELNLERTTIASPIDGYLAAIDVEIGENVTPGQRLLRVVNLDTIEVPIKLPGAAVSRVQLGDAVQMQSVSDPTRRWSCEISRISPIEDDLARTFTAYVLVHQASARRFADLLLPGTYLVATVTSSTAANHFVVPHRAIRAQHIHVIDDGLVETRNVKDLFNVEAVFPQTGLPDTQWVVLDDAGLTEGELVKVNMSTDVLDGERVTPVLPPEAKAVQKNSPPEGDAERETTSGGTSGGDL